MKERLTLPGKMCEGVELPAANPLTSAQREELNRRLDALDQEGPTGVPWDEVVACIRSRVLSERGGTKG